MRAIIFVIFLSLPTLAFAGYLDDGHSDNIPVFKTAELAINKDEASYQIKYVVPRFTKVHLIKVLGDADMIICLIRIDAGTYRGGTGYVPALWCHDDN